MRNTAREMHIFHICIPPAAQPLHAHQKKLTDTGFKRNVPPPPAQARGETVISPLKNAARGRPRPSQGLFFLRQVKAKVEHLQRLDFETSPESKHNLPSRCVARSKAVGIVDTWTTRTTPIFSPRPPFLPPQKNTSKKSSSLSCWSATTPPAPLVGGKVGSPAPPTVRTDTTPPHPC